MSRHDPIFDPDAPAQAPDAFEPPTSEPPKLGPSILARPEPGPEAPAYQLVRVATGDQRSVGVAYALFCLSFIGVAGIQHFYLGHFFRGTLWLLTWGLFGIGLIYDLFATGAQVYAFNVRRSTVVAQSLS
jgi:TM2 domain-containing membrane protein YozV